MGGSNRPLTILMQERGKKERKEKKRGNVENFLRRELRFKDRRAVTAPAGRAESRGGEKEGPGKETGPEGFQENRVP